jgi:hypothetical protein
MRMSDSDAETVKRALALTAVAATIPQRRNISMPAATAVERANERRRAALIWDSRLLLEAAHYIRPGLKDADDETKFTVAHSRSTTFELALLGADSDQKISEAAARSLRLVSAEIGRERTSRAAKEKRLADRIRQQANQPLSDDTQPTISKKDQMKLDQTAFVAELHKINARIISNERTAYALGRKADKGYGEERQLNLARADHYHDAAGVEKRRRTALSNAWPWPFQREQAVPTNKDETSRWSYECQVCFHDALDCVREPPATCQRCGAPVEHWPY